MTSHNHPTGPQPVQPPTEAWPVSATGPHPVMNGSGPQPAQRPRPPAEAFATPTDYRPYQIPQEQVLAALEASITVLHPGDTLVIRVPGWLAASQIRGYQQRVDEMLSYYQISNHVLILAGEEFARVTGEAAPAWSSRLEFPPDDGAAQSLINEPELAVAIQDVIDRHPEREPERTDAPSQVTRDPRLCRTRRATPAERSTAARGRATSTAGAPSVTELLPSLSPDRSPSRAGDLLSNPVGYGRLGFERRQRCQSQETPRSRRTRPPPSAKRGTTSWSAITWTRTRRRAPPPSTGGARATAGTPTSRDRSARELL